jgi:hypothetical protein
MAAPRLRWGLIVLALASGLAGACQICIPLPTLTLADRLLASAAVVLAREDPARPFHYRAVEVVAGNPDAAPIELFLNSHARRTLAAHPQRAMVLTQSPKDGSWSALGITSPAYEGVVRAILARKGAWQPRETDHAERLDWFVPLLGHADERLHQLAYLEIGRAPYGQIRRLASRIPADTLATMLDEPRYLEWRSLAILMLGESGRPADRARVRDTLGSMARLGASLNLAAWATALVAVDGVDGVHRLQSLYLQDASRGREELEAVVQALSVHAAAEPGLRQPVVEAYAALLDAHPSLAPSLVHDLIAWQRWEFAERIHALSVALDQDPLARYSLGLYLRLARGRPAFGRAPMAGAVADAAAPAEPSEETAK